MAVIHISQEEAERDFASVLKKLDANTSVVIENGIRSVATITPAQKHRTVEDAIALLPEHSDVDEEFAKNVLDGIERHREPTEISIFE